MTFLANLVVSYLFEKSKNLLNRTTYHGIYQYYGMVLFKVNKSVQKINNWLAEFQQKVYKEAVNQNLQFTAEIWIHDTNIPPSEK